MSNFYEPAEDSYLLEKHVRERSRGRVLDMGTGSGIQAIAAAPKARRVIACDINPMALGNARDWAAKEGVNNIEFLQCDLFSVLEEKDEKFDLMIFNPPYLIQDEGIVDKAIYGGKRGYETTQRFLEQGRDFLADDGEFLITYSDLVPEKEFMQMVDDLMLDVEKIDNAHWFFETLYILSIRKKPILRQLQGRGFSGIMPLARGKRGQVYTAMHDEKKAAIKVDRVKENISRVGYEAAFLEKLNKEGIGPQMFMHGEGFIAYWYVEGKPILEFLKEAGHDEARSVITDVLDQLRRMDKLGINKFEMQHPWKHILVQDDGKAVMIDFEKCRHTEEPKNVTQFIDFLTGTDMAALLAKAGISLDRKEMISLCREYKRNHTDESFSRIRDVFHSSYS